MQELEHVLTVYCTSRMFEPRCVECFHLCLWHFSQIRGDGTWSCILCSSESHGESLECDGLCRACDDCYPQGDPGVHRDTYGEIVHVCCRTIVDIEAIKLPGHQAVGLPDVGLGKIEWKRRGLIWRDKKRSMFSVETSRKLGPLENSENGDPLVMLKNAANK